jgi:TonB family protein
VGDGITAPVPIDKREPAYTEEARQAKIQGSVILYVEIDPEGVPRNIRVLRSLDPGLDQKAIEAVQAWRFRPGLKEGKPVAVAVQVEVNFRLI